MLKYRLNVRQGKEEMWHMLPLQVPASESRYLVYGRLIPNVTYHFQLLASVGGQWRIVCEDSHKFSSSQTNAIDLPTVVRMGRNSESKPETETRKSLGGLPSINDIPGVVPLPREPCPEMMPQRAPNRRPSFALPDMGGPSSRVSDNILDSKSLAQLARIRENCNADDAPKIQDSLTATTSELEQLVTGLLSEDRQLAKPSSGSSPPGASGTASLATGVPNSKSFLSSSGNSDNNGATDAPVPIPEKQDDVHSCTSWEELERSLSEVKDASPKL